jgi:SAM-dependent methyltransferase
MDHADHVALLRGGVPAGQGPAGQAAAVWADLGAGSGAFTLALADVLGPGGEIYAVDRDARALRENERAMRLRSPHVTLHAIQGDLGRPLPALPPLDGVVMANALHFFRDKGPVLEQVRGALKPGGRLILVEYNVDRGNVWVPYPLSYPIWETTAARCGFSGTRLLARRPSRFLHEIYSSLCFR